MSIDECRKDFEYECPVFDFTLHPAGYGYLATGTEQAYRAFKAGRDSATKRETSNEAPFRMALESIREIWAGSECGQPVHAQEAYAINLCKQMYQEAVDALRPGGQAEEGAG